MANPEHVEVVKQGAEAIGQWREKNPGVTLDLRGADLRRIILSGAKLRQANLSRTDLGGQPLLG
jgi:pentapeptide repeat protein